MNCLPTGSGVRTSRMLSVFTYLFVQSSYLIEFLHYTYVSVEVYAGESGREFYDGVSN